MPRFAANLSLMYTELPFMQRFAAAAQDGFQGIEILFPYDRPASEIALALQDSGLQAVLINTPMGDPAQGDRGLAGVPGREAEFRANLDRAIEVARVLGCPAIHLMSGVGTSLEGLPERQGLLCDNLAHAAQRLATQGLRGLIEPINTRDMPGYLLNTQAQAHALVQRIGAANLQVQMDLYHCQIVEGDVAMKMRQYLPGGAVGHLQIAGVPERHEPDVGELHYPYLMRLLDELGYSGWVGCEYRPRDTGPGGTSAGLGWMQSCR